MHHHGGMKAYSEDLRRKVVEAVEQRGMGKSEAARSFGVSLSSVKRYVAKVRQGSSLTPRKHPGPRPKIDQRARRLLEADVEERPALSLNAWCELSIEGLSGRWPPSLESACYPIPKGKEPAHARCGHLPHHTLRAMVDDSCHCLLPKRRPGPEASLSESARSLAWPSSPGGAASLASGISTATQRALCATLSLPPARSLAIQPPTSAPPSRPHRSSVALLWLCIW